MNGMKSLALAERPARDQSGPSRGTRKGRSKVRTINPPAPARVRDYFVRRRTIKVGSSCTRNRLRQTADSSVDGARLHVTPPFPIFCPTDNSSPRRARRHDPHPRKVLGVNWRRLSPTPLRGTEQDYPDKVVFCQFRGKKVCQFIRRDGFNRLQAESSKVSDALKTAGR